jgi:hypothetical protein
MVTLPKINIGELIKGTILAAVLIAGTLFGIILRAAEVNGFIIWLIVGLLNTAAAVYVYLVLKREFTVKETLEKAPEKKESTKTKEIS